MTTYEAPPASQRIWVLLFLAASAVLAVWSAGGATEALPKPSQQRLRFTAAGTIAAALGLTALVAAANDYALLEWLFFGLLCAFVLVLARLHKQAEPLAALAAALGLLLLASWPEPFESAANIAFVADLLTAATLLGALFALGGFAGLWGAERKIRWALFSIAT